MSNLVTLGPQYYPKSDEGVPLSGGSLYVGIVDTDPEIVGNQKQVKALQENGTLVNVTQPISLSGGGIPLYSGSPLSLYVEGDYSIKALDANDVQVYYVPSQFPGETQFFPGNFYYPNYEADDHGVTGNNDTVKYYVDAIGATDKATLYFKHNSGNEYTEYNFSTTEIIPDNIKLEFEEGAVAVDDVNNPDLTINGGIGAEPSQRVFGWGNGTGDIFFGEGAVEKGFINWFNKNVTPGTTDMSSAINQCATACKQYLTTVKFLGQVYLVTKSLDFTEANQNALSDQREGWLIEGAGTRATIIKPILTEAYPVMDVSGSEHVYVVDLGIYEYNDGGLQTAGILTAYTSDNNRGHWGTFDNLTIRGYFNGGAGFCCSTADQIVLKKCTVFVLEGVSIIFTSQVVSTTAWLVATVESKFSTIAQQGNTKITTRDCDFRSEDSTVSIIDEYSDWEDEGSYWACTGTSARALHFSGKSGGSSLTFTGMRMEINHSSVDTEGIFIDPAGNGILVGAILNGIINCDTAGSKAIVSEGTYISSSVLQVRKDTVNDSPLLSGDITSSTIYILLNSFQKIKNYDRANSGGNVVHVGNATNEWENVASRLYGKPPIDGSDIRDLRATNINLRKTIIGEDVASIGNQFGGIAYQISGAATGDGTADKVLFSYELPSWPTPLIEIDKPIIKVLTWGRFAANANAKDITLRLKIFDDSAAATTYHPVVTNDITGSPNFKWFKIETTIVHMREALGDMSVGAVLQTTNRIDTGVTFEYGVDVLTIEIVTDTAADELIVTKFIVTF